MINITKAALLRYFGNCQLIFRQKLYGVLDSGSHYVLVERQWEQGLGLFKIGSDSADRKYEYTGIFVPTTKEFIKKWVMEGPTHHYALGIGHHADELAKIAGHSYCVKDRKIFEKESANIVYIVTKQMLRRIAILKMRLYGHSRMAL